MGSSAVSGWVYAEKGPPPESPAVSTSAAQPGGKEPAAQEQAPWQPLTMAAEAVALSFSAMGRLFLTAAAVFGVPLRITRRLFRL